MQWSQRDTWPDVSLGSPAGADCSYAPEACGRCWLQFHVRRPSPMLPYRSTRSSKLSMPMAFRDMRRPTSSPGQWISSDFFFYPPMKWLEETEAGDGRVMALFRWERVLLAIGLCGSEGGLIRKDPSQRFELRLARSERKPDLAPFDYGAEDGHGDLEPFVRAFAVTGMHVRIIVEPAGDVVHIRRHVEVVIHAPFAGHGSVFRHRAPAAPREDLRKPAGALRSDPALAPPVVHFGHVGRARTRLHYSAHSVCKMDQAGDVIRRGVVVGKLAFSCRLAHHPLGLGVAVVPPHVVNQVREEMHHPAHGMTVDRMDAPERSAVDDFLHLAVVLAITVLVAHHRLDPGGPDRLADFDRFVHRKRHGFLVGDQLGATIDPYLDKPQPNIRRRAETEDVGADFPRYRGRIGRDPRVSQFCRRLLQTGAISRGDGGELKARVFVESRGVVLSALPHSDNNDFVDFPHVCDLSHSMHFSIVVGLFIRQFWEHRQGETGGRVVF